MFLEHALGALKVCATLMEKHDVIDQPPKLLRNNTFYTLKHIFALPKLRGKASVNCSWSKFNFGPREVHACNPVTYN